MILDFSAKLGDHEIMVHVSELNDGSYFIIVRELVPDKKPIVDMAVKFSKKYPAVMFAKRYLEEYISEL